MFGKFSKRLVCMTAMVSTMLVYGAGAANAAAPAPVSRGPVAVTMQHLNERVATVPALAGLMSGDRVTISDDGTVTGATWSGTYVFHPAGSVVPATAMYARWKDGLVALTPTPAAADGTVPGTLDASYVDQNPDVNNNEPTQVIHTLINDPTDASVLRIPNNAWLFRLNSAGQYVTLVDVFVFESGSQPLYAQTQADGTITQVAQGSQPIAVADWYWQSQ
jgi:hypothetical protein